MNVDLFLWPMVVPMIIPLLYCLKYKKNALKKISAITIVMIVIVVLYWPFLTSNVLSIYTYPAVKLLLFIVLPLLVLLMLNRSFSTSKFSQFGIRKEELKKSLWWCCLFIPIMLATTGVIFYFQGVRGTGDFFSGSLSFFEAFTEEFFFRGILFVYLVQKTNTPVAFITSFASFTLMHPQTLFTPFIIITIVQGILTIDIARRTHNIIGSWVLHGVNRFFSIAVYPFFF